jgi:hypothetical protein
MHAQLSTFAMPLVTHDLPADVGQKNLAFSYINGFPESISMHSTRCGRIGDARLISIDTGGHGLDTATTLRWISRKNLNNPKSQVRADMIHHSHLTLLELADI